MRSFSISAASTGASVSHRPRARSPRTGGRPGPPGQVDRRCPCQSVTSASIALTCSAVRSVARLPASRAARRSTRDRIAAGTAASAARSQSSRAPSRRTAVSKTSAASASSASASARSSSAVRASASATPGPSAVLQGRQHLVPDPDPGERRVLVVRVAPRLEAERGAGLLRCCARPSPSSGRRTRPAAGAIPASDRAPEPRARPSSTVSAWSSRVCASSTTSAPSSAAASAGRRTGRCGRRPPGRPRCRPGPGPPGPGRGPARGTARQRARRRRPTLAAGRGRRSPPPPAARPRARRTRSPPPAPASPRLRSRRPAPARLRGDRPAPARTASRTAATAGSSRPAALSRGLGGPRHRGRRSRPCSAASPVRTRSG